MFYSICKTRLKMNPLIMFFVIISSVLCVHKDYIKLYQELCYKDFSTVVSNPNNLAKLVRFHRYKTPDEDCDHSIGFHYSYELCLLFDRRPLYYRSSKVMGLSAFISENDRYLYVYVSLRDQLTINHINSKEVSVIIKGRVPSVLSSKHLLVLWLKEKTIESLEGHHYYQIDYIDENNTKRTEKTESFLGRTDDQVVLNGFKRNSKNQEILIRIMKSSSDISKYVSFNDSYLLFCKMSKKSVFKTTPNCQPFVEDLRIRCDCAEKSPEVYSLFLVVLFWVFCIVSIIHPLLEVLLEVEPKAQKTIFHIQHNCNDRNFKYKYVIVVRLSKVDIDLDLSDVTIDIEFFSTNNESIAPNHRFRAKVVENRPVTDIKLIMWRLTKIPELKIVQCSHSGSPGKKILLLGLLVQYISGEPPEDDTVWSYKLHKNIIRTERQFNLRRTKGTEKDVSGAEGHPMPIYLHQIPLSYLEIFFVLFMDISFIAFISMFLTMDFISNIALKMFVLILCLTVLGIFYNTIFVLVYKCLIRLEYQHKTRMQTQKMSVYYYGQRVFIGICVVSALFIQVFLVMTKETDKFIELYRWVVIITCSIELVAIFWYESNRIYLSYLIQRQQSESDLTVNSASVDPIV